MPSIESTVRTSWMATRWRDWAITLAAFILAPAITA